MTYKEHLEKIKYFTDKTVTIYMKYAGQLKEANLNYKSILITSSTSINTKRLMISAFKSYYKFLDDKRWQELTLPKKEIIVKDFVSFNEYKFYLSKINHKSKMGFQKRLIVRLLFETGIRSSELLKIKKSHINGNRIKIQGKGRKERYVKVSNWLLDELETYSKNKDLLFPFGYKNLYSKIKRIDEVKKLTPHMFRRGYAKYCYEKEISIYDISLSMGHSNIDTTASYIKRDSEDVEIHKIF